MNKISHIICFYSVGGARWRYISGGEAVKSDDEWELN